ncbi:MAG: hypothetical protein M1839_001106 [Geoglossum umbratile]|nr:MAG: hypothetical protein M1839_001106 [Geoglossum umbratile]
MAMPRDSMLGREDSQPEPVCGNAQIDSPLTSLPPELRLQILSELDLDQLSALVRASPAFHRDYRRSRRSTLTKCLQVTFRSVAVDACAAFQSSSDEFAEAWTRDKVTQFLHSYQDQRASAHNSHAIKHLTEDEAISMAAFHSSIVEPFARCYVDWALTNLFEETKGSLNNGLLSKAEETRVLRALYRFQLCCNLFGWGRFSASSWRKWRRDAFYDIDILKLFLCLFEPWEVEEIACIYAFAKEKLDQIFEDIRWDVHEENPKFEGQRPPTPVGAFHLDIRETRDELLEGTISRGLDLLHMLFSGVWDHAQLVLVMQAQIIFLPRGFLEGAAWSDIIQQELREEAPSHRDQKQERRDPLPFTGDGDSETDGPRPPLAWTVMWGGTYSNLFGDYVKHVIHRWGYVMWDAVRLERTGGKELLVRQLKEEWRDTDPRDVLD